MRRPPVPYLFGLVRTEKLLQTSFKSKEISLKYSKVYRTSRMKGIFPSTDVRTAMETVIRRKIGFESTGSTNLRVIPSIQCFEFCSVVHCWPTSHLGRLPCVFQNDPRGATPLPHGLLRLLVKRLPGQLLVWRQQYPQRGVSVSVGQDYSALRLRYLGQPLHVDYQSK